MLALSVYGIAGWLFIAVLIVSSINQRIAAERYPNSSMAHIHENLSSRWTWLRRPLSSWVLFGIVTMLEISQIWGYFVIQHQQLQMTQAEGVSFVDEQWAFGQVVAVVAFAPVLVKAWSAVVRVRRQAVETAS